MHTQNAKRGERLRPSTLEWHMCEDEREWELAQQHLDEAVLTTPPAWWGQLVMWRWSMPTLILLLVLGMFSGWWFWRRAQLGIAEVEREVAAEVVAELWHDRKPQSNGDRAVSGKLNPFSLPSDPGEIVAQAQVRDLGRDWALIEVTLQLSKGGPSYRQTRFYRASEWGWVREQPTVAHWGEARQLESDYFVFQYYALDEAAVKQVAPKIDALYPQLVEVLFAKQTKGGKVPVTISPEQQPGLLHLPDVPPDDLILASPLATLAPTDQAASDILLQSLVLALYEQLMVDAFTESGISLKWFRLYNGLQIWLLWEHDLPLAKWRMPLVQWLFDQPQEVRVTDVYAVPEFARELCVHHMVWMRSPLDIGVPILCWRRNNGEEKLSAWRYHHTTLQGLSPTSLLYFRVATPDDTGLLYDILLPEPSPSALLMATLLEYVAATYGKEKIPQLMLAIPAHDKGETLIPAVFGVSHDQFTAEWNAYLADEYQITR